MERSFAFSRRRLLAGAAGLALGISGVAAQADDKTPLRLGVLTDMSSLYADVTGPGSVVAAKMAVEDFQAASPKMKRPIEVLTGDHTNKADLGANIAREWIDRSNVDAIIDVPNSAVALAVRNVVQQNNKALIVSGASSSDLTGKACSPNLVHWSYDTYALSSGTARAVVAAGGKTWFTLTADYAFGHAMEAEVKNVVSKLGGSVVGGVRTPINTQDFSSFLLQAQSSKAQIIGLINAGGDTINSIKQSVEFGIPQGGQRVVATVLYLSDVHALGLKVAQGLQFTEAFYWDMNDETRAWAKRFAPRNNGRYPTAMQAGVYAATLHYLKAADALGSTSDGKAVVQEMKKLPTDDPLFGKGSIRADGRKLHNMYLFEVKKPEESKYPWDYYRLIKTIPASEAFRPLEEGGCDFLKS
ncbi:ABC transporter substrate-binding protein [Bradyrhizobium tropiciagri]|uniref:ABC transporter substrate-binding protein n=1 Tax=Bradyrhizobium tropiciagri TaxID=312253 RepID=UPI001BA5CF94|nr:ABC transporter substrate-binding protein [Bradyrhizobium tropiciagri]MBR0873620.1 ABC transporter substrate-binding protein [Bradyrhizobium tropiciagri]